MAKTEEIKEMITQHELKHKTTPTNQFVTKQTISEPTKTITVSQSKNNEIEEMKQQHQKQLEEKIKQIEEFEKKLQIQQQSKPTKQKQGKKISLLIGNSNYTNCGILSNPIQDVQLIEKQLKQIGFETIIVYDLKEKKDFRKVINEFVTKLNGIGNELECCLFYYAGHGISSKERNYLIPTTVDLQIETDIEDDCVNLNCLMFKLSEASSSTSVNIIIIDACKSDLKLKSTNIHDMKQGLVTMSVPTNSFVLLSTAPGTKSIDRCEESRNNSPFAFTLSKELKPDIELYDVFLNVSSQVEILTRKMQNPFVSSSLKSKFYL